MARIKADREPRPGERKIRAGLYITARDLADLAEIAEELPGVNGVNGAVVYLKEMYKARKAARTKRGLEGPVPLYEADDLVV